MKEYNKNEIMEILENLSDSDILSIHREMDSYDSVYEMDEFNEICDSMDAHSIACRVFYGDFRPCDSYFTFDGYENFKSSDYLSDLIYFDEMVDFVIGVYTDGDSLNIDELDNYFESLEEEEKEEEEEEE